MSTEFSNKRPVSDDPYGSKWLTTSVSMFMDKCTREEGYLWSPEGKISPEEKILYAKLSKLKVELRFPRYFVFQEVAFMLPVFLPAEQ
jgi:hypothetical protein